MSDALKQSEFPLGTHRFQRAVSARDRLIETRRFRRLLACFARLWLATARIKPSALRTSYGSFIRACTLEAMRTQGFSEELD
jgi:hypothetical protein